MMVRARETYRGIEGEAGVELIALTSTIFPPFCCGITYLSAAYTVC